MKPTERGSVFFVCLFLILHTSRWEEAEKWERESRGKSKTAAGFYECSPQRFTSCQYNTWRATKAKPQCAQNEINQRLLKEIEGPEAWKQKIWLKWWKVFLQWTHRSSVQWSSHIPQRFSCRGETLSVNVMYCKQHLIPEGQSISSFINLKSA